MLLRKRQRRSVKPLEELDNVEDLGNMDATVHPKKQRLDASSELSNRALEQSCFTYIDPQRFSDHQWQLAIERVVVHHSATGGKFASGGSRSGHLTVHPTDVDRVKKASVKGYDAMGNEIATLLGAVLSERSERMQFDPKQYARELHGHLHILASQAPRRLGSITARTVTSGAFFNFYTSIGILIVVDAGTTSWKAAHIERRDVALLSLHAEARREKPPHRQ